MPICKLLVLFVNNVTKVIIGDSIVALKTGLNERMKKCNKKQFDKVKTWYIASNLHSFACSSGVGLHSLTKRNSVFAQNLGETIHIYIRIASNILDKNRRVV